MAVLAVRRRPTSARQTRWRQYIAAVAASTGVLSSGAWFCWPAPLLPRLLAQGSPVPMTPQEAAWMVSSIEIGNLISPFPATFIADRHGRKLSILLSAPLFLVGFFLTIFIKNVWALCIARVIQGIAMGLPFTILPLYLGEIASPESRGTVTSFFHIAWGVGCLFPYCVGPFVSYDVFTCATFLLNVLFVLCFIWQPETPYYYAMKGDSAKTSEMLLQLRDSPSDESIRKELEEIQLEVKKCLEVKISWTDVFVDPADRKGLILLLIVGAVGTLSGQNAILTYTTETFSKFPNNIISPDAITIGIGIVSLLGSIFTIMASDRFGRRFLLLISSTGAMVTLVIASVYFYFFSNTSVDISLFYWIAPVAVISFNFFIVAGMHPVCVTYSSELFPTKTRGVASSISNVNITFCSFLVLICYESMTIAVGVYFTYMCYAVVCLVGAVLSYYMMPETRGKTFLEIREALVKSRR